MPARFTAAFHLLTIVRRVLVSIPPSGQKDKRRFQARQRHTPGDGVYLVKGCENLLFAIIKKRWQGASIFLSRGLVPAFAIIRQDRDIIICILIITQRRYLAQVNNSGKV
jgi:hypothetical protein